MNKKFLSVLITSGFLMVPVTASANPVLEVPENRDLIEEQVSVNELSFTHSIRVYSLEGVEEFKVKKDMTFGEFLQKHGLEDKMFQTREGKELDRDASILTEWEIVKVSRDASTEIITLKFPEVEVETDELFIGETRVKTEGKDGKALKTTFYTFNSDSKEQNNELQAKESQFTLVTMPIEQVIEVGTKEEVQEPESPSPQTSYTPVPVRDLPPNPTGNSIVETALSYVGYPYVWAGTSPSGFDCSGFVQYVHGQHGISLPRMSDAQGKSGTRVSNPQPGDLVVWPGQHIAIYIGNGQIVHASNPRDGVKVGPLYGSYYFSRLG